MREYDAEAEKDTKDEGGRTERCEVRQKGMNTNTTRKGLTGRGRRVAVVGGGRTSSEEEEEDAVG